MLRRLVEPKVHYYETSFCKALKTKLKYRVLDKIGDCFLDSVDYQKLIITVI